MGSKRSRGWEFSSSVDDDLAPVSKPVTFNLVLKSLGF
jgi:hypothetical protein